jgi:hypothetical protein
MAWAIDVTPIRVVDDAVTFRLRWKRVAAIKQQLEQLSLDGSKASGVPGDDLELTLRPGESWPVDSVRMPSGAKNLDGRVCRGNSASIHVAVDAYPSAEWEGRVVVADLWLVERLASGGEAQRSQPLSVRGLPNRAMPFYFDSITDANLSLDIYGSLNLRPGRGTTRVALETLCHWGEPADLRNFRGPQRSVPSTVDVTPGEIVEIRLPQLGGRAAAFATRQFSIRIRVRQLR